MNPTDIEQKADEYMSIFKKWSDWFLDAPLHSISTLAVVLLGWYITTNYKKIGDKSVELIDKTTNQLTLLAIKCFSNISFSLRYKKHIIFEHRVFNVRGLRTQGTFTLEVEKVYVSLRIAPCHNPNKANSITHHESLQGNRPIWDFLKQDLKILAVIGAPGCGKSTLLQHIALAFAANNRHGLPAYTPVFLFLREHIDKIVSEEINLAQLAQAHFSNENRYPDLQPPENWFKTQLNNGKAIVLLDGLDEVADVEKRQKVSAWVDQQIINYKKCPFIITSRPQGYLAAPLKQAHRLEIQPFSWSQVQEFAHSWYFQNEVLSFGKKDEGVVNRAKQGAEDLLKRLQQMPSLNALTVNPLLLTMIAMVHRYRGQLPGRRVELYTEICDVLLGHWRSAIGVQDSLTATQKRVALQPLAANMMRHYTREISTEDAIAIIAEPLRQVGLSEQQAGVQFLKDIEAGSGLLSEKENGLWSFAHLSFQEYLTACHWAEQKNKLDWRFLVDKSWWHETIRLYIAQADAKDIVLACLRQNSLSSLTLASECVDEALKLDNETRQKLWDVLEENLESSETARSQLAAEVRLARRLKNLQRLNDTTEIDAEFISCAEYQLFLNDREKNYQPAHWQTRHFPQNTAKKAVLGISSADAQEFCKWLSEKTGENYRLPTPLEIQQITIISRTQYATWCLEQNNSDLVWQHTDDKNTCIQKVTEISSLPIQFNFDLQKKYVNKYQIIEFILNYYEYSFLTHFRAQTLAQVIAQTLNLDSNHEFTDLIPRHPEKINDSIFVNFAIFSPLISFVMALVYDFNFILVYYISVIIGIFLLSDSNSNSNSNSNLDHKFAYARAFALDIDLNLDLDLTRARTRLLDFELEFDFDRVLARSNLIARLELLDNLYTQQLVNLFKTLSTAINTADRFSIRNAARKITLFELETLLTTRWTVYCDALKPELTWQQRLFFWKKPQAIDTQLLRDVLLAWFWAFKIIDARIEGKLDAWEGIRIVREQAKL